MYRLEQFGGFVECMWLKDKFDGNWDFNVELEMFLTYMRLKQGFRFIWHYQNAELAFLRYVDSLGEPTIHWADNKNNFDREFSLLGEQSSRWASWVF